MPPLSVTGIERCHTRNLTTTTETGGLYSLCARDHMMSAPPDAHYRRSDEAERASASHRVGIGREIHRQP
jgi:hypothetical protein